MLQFVSEWSRDVINFGKLERNSTLSDDIGNHRQGENVFERQNLTHWRDSLQTTMQKTARKRDSGVT
jgi:hypothetical protein